MFISCFSYPFPSCWTSRMLASLTQPLWTALQSLWVCECLWGVDFESFRYTPRSDVAGLYGRSTCKFSEARPCWFSIVAGLILSEVEAVSTTMLRSVTCPCFLIGGSCPIILCLHLHPGLDMRRRKGGSTPTSCLWVRRRRVNKLPWVSPCWLLTT